VRPNFNNNLNLLIKTEQSRNGIHSEDGETAALLRRLHEERGGELGAREREQQSAEQCALHVRTVPEVSKNHKEPALRNAFEYLCK